jgi:hypothetical protein
LEFATLETGARGGDPHLSARRECNWFVSG